MKVEYRHSNADIGSAVFAGKAINGVLPKISAASGFFYGLAGFFGKHHLVKPYRTINIEKTAAGILAEGKRPFLSQLNIAFYDIERILSNAVLLFSLNGLVDNIPDISG